MNNEWDADETRRFQREEKSEDATAEPLLLLFPASLNFRNGYPVL